jgi:hypothetical protein
MLTQSALSSHRAELMAALSPAACYEILCSSTQLQSDYDRHQLPLNGQYHKIFCLRFFHKIIYIGPCYITLTYFPIWLRILRDLRDFRKFMSCVR